MKTWIRLALAIAFVSSTNLSCSVNDYCLECLKGDGGGSGGFMDAGDANGSGSDAPDAGCVATGPEECNGKDDDCNGQIDDGTAMPGVGAPCSNQVGACAGSKQICQNGALKCDYQLQPETCDGIDNNCSGAVDEGDPGGGAICGTNQGECVAGQFHCNPSTGALECFGFQDHTMDPELCDGKDNDCDGNFDEGIGSLGTCGPTTSVGECNQGTLMCMGGQPVCTGAVFPKFETCNNLDDNCDGNIDEIFNKLTDPTNCGGCGVVCPAHANANTVCQSNGAMPPMGVCGYTCKPGYHDLVSGGGANDGCEYGPCFATGVEECDGIDNDCDNKIDEGLTPPAICKSGGECGTTAPTAVCNGASGWSCTYPGTVQFPETLCDGKDNNCDGNIDENQPNKGQACHEDRENPTTQCADAVDNDNDGKVNDGCPQVGNTAETAAQCANATDDDADGKVNDGCPAIAQLGVCEGSGSYQCDPLNLNGPAYCQITTAGSAPSAEACDNKDNNCNGQVDEGGSSGTLVGQEWVTLPDGKQMMRFEASKPDATNADSGSVNALVCSKSGVLPWTNVKYQDAVAACATIGAKLCTEQDWHRACSLVSGLTYNPSIGDANIGTTTGVFIEAEDYSGIAYGGVAETACTGSADDDLDGAVNDGCPAVGAPETKCSDAADSDGDGTVNDGCPTVGPAFVPDYTDPSATGYSGISAMKATPNLGANVTAANSVTQSARLDYLVHFPSTGNTYHVWVRMNSLSNNDNTVYVGIGTTVTPPAQPTATVATSSNGTWQWRDAGAFNITAISDRYVSVFMGKDGVKVDKIFIVKGNTNPTSSDVVAPHGNKWAYSSSQNTYQPNTCNGHDYRQVNISNVARNASGVVTITTSATHPFVVGDLVQVQGTADASIDGNYTVLTATSTTFTYQQNTTTAVSSVASTGTATEARDPILTAGSLTSCYANQGAGLFDMSGNVREWTRAHTPNENPIRGGASNGTADGISCPLNFTLADDTFFFPNIGFRCCK